VADQGFERWQVIQGEPGDGLVDHDRGDAGQQKQIMPDALA
jgi:hypothetical protein